MISPEKLIKYSIAILFVAAPINHVAAKSLEKISLLKSTESYRTIFNAQPNLERGEYTMPASASVIYIIEQPLKDFLEQLTTRNKLKLTISDKVSGILQRVLLPMQVEMILPELAKSYGVEWYLDGDHLFVSNNLENTNRLINLGSMNLLQLNKTLDKLGLKAGTNKISFQEDKNSILLTGSRTFISKVESIIKGKL